GVIELAEPRERAAVGQRAVVGNPARAAAVAAVVGHEYLVAAPAALDRVGGEVDLVRLRAGEPGAVAVVALGGASIPRLAPVDRREERVVREVDPRVVDASARVLRQVGVAEARVDRRARGARTGEVA